MATTCHDSRRPSRCFTLIQDAHVVNSTPEENQVEDMEQVHGPGPKLLRSFVPSNGAYEYGNVEAEDDSLLHFSEKPPLLPLSFSKESLLLPTAAPSVSLLPLTLAECRQQYQPGILATREKSLRDTLRSYFSTVSVLCLIAIGLTLKICHDLQMDGWFDLPGSVGFSPSMKPIMERCSALSSISKQSFVERRDNLAKVLGTLGDGDIFLTEPGATGFYYGELDTKVWSLSERTFMLGITSTINSNGEIEAKTIILTPEFEAARAKLLTLPGLNDDLGVGSGRNSSLVYVEWQESESPAEVLVKYLSRSSSFGEERKGRRTIHLDPYVRSFIFDGFNQATKGTSVEGEWEVKVASGDVLVRERKSAEEIELLTCANELTLESIKATRAQMAFGITESKTREILKRYLKKAGLEGGDGLVLFGENAALPHGSGTDRTLGENDFVLIDCGGKFHGYVSDVTRTFALKRSKLSGTQMRIWNTVQSAQKGAIRAAVEGAHGREVDEAARKVVESKGIREVEKKGFSHRLGHGIGLEGHESPYLVGSNANPLKAGNVFSDEPGIYILGEVGVRLEDCFYVNPETGRGVMFTGPAESPWVL